MYLKSNLPKNKNSYSRKKLNLMNQLNCCKLMFATSVLLVIVNCVELLAFINYSLNLKDGQRRLEIKTGDDRETFTKEIKDLRAEIEKITQVIII